MHKSSISSPNKYTSQLLGCAFFSVDKFKSQKLEMLEVKNYIHLLLLKSFLSRYLPRWQHRLLNSPPPQTQQIYNYMWNNSFGKKSDNWINRVSIIEDKWTTSKQVGEVQIQISQEKHTPSHGDLQFRRNTEQ